MYSYEYARALGQLQEYVIEINILANGCMYYTKPLFGENNRKTLRRESFHHILSLIIYISLKVSGDCYFQLFLSRLSYGLA